MSADFISTVTDSVLEAVVEWQNRPLERSYPVVYFDALRVKIRDEGSVRNKAVYLALGIAADGTKDVLGIWIEQNEGAKFWLKVMNELRNRGLEDNACLFAAGRSARRWRANSRPFTGPKPPRPLPSDSASLTPAPGAESIR